MHLSSATTEIRFTAHRTVSAVYGPSRARDREHDLNCLPWFFLGEQYFQPILVNPAITLIQHGRVFTPGTDLPGNPYTINLSKCSACIVPQYVVQCQHGKEEDQYSL